MADIIVKDESYSEMSTTYGEIATTMESRLDSYINILDNICSDGITDGNVHDNLVLFQNKVSTMKGELQACVSEVQELCTKFVEDIDEADSELY